MEGYFHLGTHMKCAGTVTVILLMFFPYMRITLETVNNRISNKQQ